MVICDAGSDAAFDVGAELPPLLVVGVCCAADDVVGVCDCCVVVVGVFDCVVEVVGVWLDCELVDCVCVFSEVDEYT